MKRFLPFLLFTSSFPIFGLSQVDTIDFESFSTHIEIDTSSQNIWQIGTPSKWVFDTAYAGTKAILTDTLNPYPTNNRSSFTLGFDIYGGRPRISFQYRINSSFGRDGGYVELSQDGGQSWRLLTDTSGNPNFYQYYGPYGLYTTGFYSASDTLFDGTPGFSGSVDSAWRQAEVIFPCYAIKKPHQHLLRFTFISDSVTGTNVFDGWMIDNIVVDNSGFCSSLAEDEVLPRISATPNPISDAAWLDLGNLNLVGGHLEIYDQQGRLIHRENGLEGNRVYLQRHSIPAGFYQAIIKDAPGRPVALSRLVFK